MFKLEELQRVAKDKLGHQLHVGDLVVDYAYSNNVELYRIRKYMERLHLSR